MFRPSGFQIFEEIRGIKRLFAIPVVFFSSSLEMGAAAYVHKPVDLDGFARAVDEICSFVAPVN
jgi:DNA-binding response OmpR family regulator